MIDVEKAIDMIKRAGYNSYYENGYVVVKTRDHKLIKEIRCGAGFTVSQEAVKEIINGKENRV